MENSQPIETEHKCDLCKAPMLLRTSRRGQKFLGCSKYPDCRFTLPVDAEGNPVRPVATEEVCEKCGKPMVIKSGRRGRFLACSGYPECRSTSPLPADLKEKSGTEKKPSAEKGPQPGKPKPEPTDIMCEECGQPMVIRSGRHGKFLGCSAYPKCKTTKPLPDELK